MIDTQEALLRYFRPSVRSQKPYIVSGTQEDPPVKLNQNESPFDLPAEIKQELLKTVLEIPFNRYPKEQPYLLRNALAAHLNHPAEGILIGNGSNELTYTLGLSLIDRGTLVVLPTPMFALYTTMVHLYEGKLIAVPPLDNLHFDVDGLCHAIQNNKPALTVVTTPNNPTGLSLPLEAIDRIADLATGFVVVDEAYVEFSEEESAFTLLEKHANIILVRTFSKAFGLAGLRLGYFIARPDVIREFIKSRLPFMVSRFAETVALAMLKNTDLVAERIAFMKASCKHLTASLQAMNGVQVIPSQANFVLLKTAHEPGALIKKMAGHGVLVRNMNGYPELAGYLRVNAGSHEENKAFLRALEDAL